MFQHLLVFLDGSRRAELALPVAARLARSSGASLTLVRMATLPADFTWSKLEPPFRDREILASEIRQTSTYLKSKAWELELAGLAVQTHILPGLAFPQIQALIKEEQIDLVVICSRGFIPFRPQARGSMTRRMIQECHVPVLALQETVDQQGTLSYRSTHPVRIMVPLDGSARAETALVPAAILAAELSAPASGMLHLVSVLPFSDVSPSGKLINSQHTRIQNDRQAYLRATARMLCEGEMKHLNLSITTAVLAGPDIAEALIGATEKMNPPAETACDILALTPPGDSGPDYLSIGSRMEHILQETHLPFLVIHPLYETHPSELLTNTQSGTAEALS